jgi:hypothetical protein
LSALKRNFHSAEKINLSSDAASAETQPSQEVLHVFHRDALRLPIQAAMK